MEELGKLWPPPSAAGYHMHQGNAKTEKLAYLALSICSATGHDGTVLDPNLFCKLQERSSQPLLRPCKPIVDLDDHQRIFLPPAHAAGDRVVFGRRTAFIKRNAPMKIRIIALATTFVLSSSMAFAQTGTVTPAPGSGTAVTDDDARPTVVDPAGTLNADKTTGANIARPATPGVAPGARDKSRTGGQGVNDRPAGK